MIRRAGRLALLGACAICWGCQPATRSEAKKYPVSGTVTLDQQPMPDGQIYFKTVAEGSLDIIPVKDGKFQGQAQAGQRRVEVYSFKEEMSAEMKKMYGDKPPAGTASKTNTIPAKWNTESKLTAEVKTSGVNEFKFDITSK